MRQDRVEFRTNASERRLFEEAAGLVGMNLSSFLRAIALERSVEILKQQSVFSLSDKDRDAFLNALETPPKPNKELQKAYQEYKQFVERE